MTYFFFDKKICVLAFDVFNSLLKTNFSTIYLFIKCSSFTYQLVEAEYKSNYLTKINDTIMPAPLPFSYFLKPENMLIKIHLANFRWRRNIKNFFCKELSKISEAHEQ